MASVQIGEKTAQNEIGGWQKNILWILIAAFAISNWLPIVADQDKQDSVHFS